MTAVNIIRRTLADGTVKEYRYGRRKPSLDSRHAPESLGGLIIAYKGSPEWPLLKDNTRDGYTLHLKALEAIAATPFAEVERQHILGIRNVIARTRGNGAAQAFVRVAQALFSWAVENGKLTVSPGAQIKALPGGEFPAWTTEQALYAEARLPEELRRVVLLARHTGQRRGDLVAMKWSAYDGRTIRVKQEKTGVEVAVPCLPELRAELDAWKREGRSVFILTSHRGRPWQGHNLTQRLPAWLARIELPNAQRLNMHGLRKLAATTLAEAGCSAHEIASITGHKTLSMVQHYTKSVNQQALAEQAMAKLERAFAKR